MDIYTHIHIYTNLHIFDSIVISVNEGFHEDNYDLFFLLFFGYIKSAVVSSDQGFLIATINLN